MGGAIRRLGTNNLSKQVCGTCDKTANTQTYVEMSVVVIPPAHVLEDSSGSVEGVASHIREAT